YGDDPVQVTVTADDTADNMTAADLINDLNAAIIAAGLTDPDSSPIVIAELSTTRRLNGNVDQFVRLRLAEGVNRTRQSGLSQDASSPLAIMGLNAVTRDVLHFEDGQVSVRQQTGDLDVRRLLPPEGDFDAIIIDGLGGDDQITVGPTVIKSVWIDGGAGDDIIDIQEGRPILPDAGETSKGNETSVSAYEIPTPRTVVTSAIAATDGKLKSDISFTVEVNSPYFKDTTTKYVISLKAADTRDNTSLGALIADLNAAFVTTTVGNQTSVDLTPYVRVFQAGTDRIGFAATVDGPESVLNVWAADSSLPTAVPQAQMEAAKQLGIAARGSEQADAEPRLLLDQSRIITGLTIDDESDVDWYRFTLPTGVSGNSGNSVILTSLSADDQITFELYQRDTNGVLQPTTSTQFGNRHRISLNGVGSADTETELFLKVSSHRVPTVYQLEFTAPDYLESHATVPVGSTGSNAVDLEAVATAQQGADVQFRQIGLVTGLTLHDNADTDLFTFKYQPTIDATKDRTVSALGLKGSAVTVTVTESHGLKSGDTVYVKDLQGNNVDALNGRTYVVTVLSDTSFELQQADSTGTLTPVKPPTDSTYSSGGTIRRSSGIDRIQLNRIQSTGQLKVDLFRLTSGAEELISTATTNPGDTAALLTIATLQEERLYLRIRHSGLNDGEDATAEYELQPIINGDPGDVLVQPNAASVQLVDLGSQTRILRRDILIGGAGNDRLSGGSGEEWILGGPGDDVLNGGADRQASDLMWGGPGNDTFQIIPSDLPVTKTSERFVGIDGTNTKTFIPTYSDRFDGGEGTDRVLFLGGDVDDQGRVVPDNVAVRYNTILHRYEVTAQVWNEDLQQFATVPGTNTPLQHYAFFQVAGSVEGASIEQFHIDTRSGDDVVHADPEYLISGSEWGIDPQDKAQRASLVDLTISGGPGNDRLLGGAGNDTILGGPGLDVIRGGGGNDNIDGGDGADWIAGGPDETLPDVYEIPVGTSSSSASNNFPGSAAFIDVDYTPLLSLDADGNPQSPKVENLNFHLGDTQDWYVIPAPPAWLSTGEEQSFNGAASAQLVRDMLNVQFYREDGQPDTVAQDRFNAIPATQRIQLFPAADTNPNDDSLSVVPVTEFEGVPKYYLVRILSPAMVEQYQGLIFDGADDRVLLPEVIEDFSYSGGITVEAMIKPGLKATGSHGVIFDTGRFRIATYSENNSLKISYAFAKSNTTGATWAWVNTNVEVAADIWTHLAISYAPEAQNVVLWLNGVEKYTNNSITYNLDLDADPLVNRSAIGSRADNGSVNAFKGTIRDVRLWNRALSADELAPTRLGTVSASAEGLVAWWPLNDAINGGTPTTAADLSQNRVTGTLGTGDNQPTWAVETSAVPSFGHSYTLTFDSKKGLGKTINIGVDAASASITPTDAADRPVVIPVGDINGDGYDDFIGHVTDYSVPQTSGSSNIATVSSEARLYFGSDFTGGYDPTQQFVTLQLPAPVLVKDPDALKTLFTYGDFNGDGRSDLAVTGPQRQHSSADYQSIVTSLGPIAYYTFDQSTGSTIPNLVSGKPNSTLDGASLTADGAFEGGVQFAGGQRVAVGTTTSNDDITLGTDGWTISTWFKDVQLPPAGKYSVLARRKDTADNDVPVLIDSQGRLGTVDRSPNEIFYPSGYTISPDQFDGWHHLAARGKDGGTRFYIDGRLVGTSTYQTNHPIKWIGNDIPNSTNIPFAAGLDEFAVFPNALTDDQIQLLAGWEQRISILLGRNDAFDLISPVAAPALSGEASFRLKLDGQLLQTTDAASDISGVFRVPLSGNLSALVDAFNAEFTRRKVAGRVQAVAVDSDNDRTDDQFRIRLLQGTSLELVLIDPETNLLRTELKFTEGEKNPWHQAIDLTGLSHIDFADPNSQITGDVYITGLGTGPVSIDNAGDIGGDTSGGIDAVNNLSAADPSRASGTYKDVEATTTGNGSGALFTVVVDDSGAATIEIAKGGAGYAVDDVLTIADADLGGGGAGNLTFNVSFVAADGADDLVIGTPEYDNGTSIDVGAVRIYHGNTGWGSADRLLAADFSAATFNADGYAENDREGFSGQNSNGLPTEWYQETAVRTNPITNNSEVVPDGFFRLADPTYNGGADYDTGRVTAALESDWIDLSSVSAAQNVDLSFRYQLVTEQGAPSFDHARVLLSSEESAATENIITITGHGFGNLDKVRYTVGTGSSAINGLYSGLDYYVIKLTDDTFRLAATLDDAANGRAVWLADTGIGTLHTLERKADAANGIVQLSKTFDPQTTGTVTTVTLLASNATTGSQARIQDPQNNWSTIELPNFTGLRGRVKVRFDFETFDSVSNNYSGWKVDDVVVRARATEVSVADTTLQGSSASERLGTDVAGIPGQSQSQLVILSKENLISVANPAALTSGTISSQPADAGVVTAGRQASNDSVSTPQILPLAGVFSDSSFAVRSGLQTSIYTSSDFTEDPIVLEGVSGLLGDLDGDGTLDLVMIVAEDSFVLSPQGTLQQHLVGHVVSGKRLAGLNPEQITNKLLNAPDMVVETGKPFYSSNPWAVAEPYAFGTAGDINGDGLPDVAVADTIAGNQLHIFAGAEVKTEPYRPVDTSGNPDDYYTYDIATPWLDVQIDITGIDLHNSETLSLGQAFAFNGVNAAEQVSQAVNVGDVNGDRFDDLMLYGTTIGYLVFGPVDVNAIASVKDFASVTFVLTNLGIPQPTRGDLGGPESLAADGIDDLVFRTSTGTENIIWGRGQQATLPAYYTLFNVPQASPMGDVDGDGRSDVFNIVQTSDNDTAVSLGVSSRRSPVVITAATTPGTLQTLSVMAGDIDGDGRSDLAVLRTRKTITGGTQVDGTLFVFFDLLNQPASLSLTDADVVIPGTPQSGLLTHLTGSSFFDINADGFDDILVGAAGFDVTTDRVAADAGRVYVIYGSGDRSILPTDGVETIANRSVSGSGDFVVNKATGSPDVIQQGTLGPVQPEQWYRFTTVGDGLPGNYVEIGPQPLTGKTISATDGATVSTSPQESPTSSALKFTDKTGVVLPPSILNGLTDFTIEFWMKPDQGSANQTRYILSAS
ncbi:MAG: VCBS repeat-containing protein, partial [Planctomycetaceae bacterium]|nr:VCBS repeat-containing protein [Planctomycetaceae bacterium]